MTYNPKPIDTSKIDIPESLEELTEKIAEHIHDVWACKRIEEGWSYGPARNGEDKKHPDLVHYAELTESEKDYDRATVIETIKVIIALGYGIKKK